MYLKKLLNLELSWVATGYCPVQLASEFHLSVSALCLLVTHGKVYVYVTRQEALHIHCTIASMPLTEDISQMLGSMSKESSFNLLDAYFEQGGNFIDTAVSFRADRISGRLTGRRRTTTKMGNLKSGLENG